MRSPLPLLYICVANFPRMSRFAAFLSFAYLILLVNPMSSSAQVACDSFRCSGGKSLKVLGQSGNIKTFEYDKRVYELAQTSPYGANFMSYGDTQSPKGTGISFSGSGIAVIINGATDYSCK